MTNIILKSLLITVSLVITFGFLAGSAEAQKAPKDAKIAGVTVDCADPKQLIQSAVNNATSPTEVFISGTCFEDVTITKDDITLNGGQGLGLNLGGVGTISGTVSIVGARRIILENLTIEGSGHGIVGSENATFTLSYVVVDGNAESGVVLNSGAVATIKNSEITNNLGADLSGIEVNANGLVLLEETLVEGNGTGDPCQLEVTRGRAVLVEGNTLRASIGWTICALDLGSVNAFPGGVDEIIENTGGGVALGLSRQSLGNLRGVDITGQVIVNKNSMLEARNVSIDGSVFLTQSGNGEFRNGSEITGNLDVLENGFAALNGLSIAGALNAFTGAVVNTFNGTTAGGGVFCGPTGLVFGNLSCP